LSQFNNELIGVLFENTYAFQLTDKCSIGCLWCGFDAEILKKNDQMNFITYDEMYWIFKNYSKVLAKSKPMLHWASEPFDHPEYERIYELAEYFSGYSPNIITAFPKGKEKRIKQFLNKKKCGRISLIYKESGRISNFERLKETGIINEKKEPMILGINIEERVSTRLFKAGRNIKRGSSFFNESLSCYNGILIDPHGVYNTFTSIPSESLKNGVLKIKILPGRLIDNKSVRDCVFLSEILERYLIQKQSLLGPKNLPKRIDVFNFCIIVNPYLNEKYYVEIAPVDPSLRVRFITKIKNEKDDVFITILKDLIFRQILFQKEIDFINYINIFEKGKLNPLSKSDADKLRVLGIKLIEKGYLIDNIKRKVEEKAIKKCN